MNSVFFASILEDIIITIVVLAAALGTFHLVAEIIRYSALILDSALLIVRLPVTLLIRGLNYLVPYSEWNTYAVQAVAGAVFFCYFTTRIATQNRTLVFMALLVLVCAAVFFGLWLRARYRPRFSEILFDHRFVKPILDWVSSQRRAILLMGYIPLLWPIVVVLDEVAARINHRRWQSFLRSAFALSIFTLPVQLFPGVDAWISNEVVASLHPRLLEIISSTPGIQAGATAVATAYLYLFDWMLTIIVMYVIVRVLSPIEPRNLFSGVLDALKDFVIRRRVFCFGALYWPYHDGARRPAIYSRDANASQWSDLAQSLHRLSEELDLVLPVAGQGINSRIAVVYETGSDAKQSGYCMHYRRLGKAAFVATVDNRRGDFSGRNARSQHHFKQLSESIGALINVRDSLK
jgi:hypothetical protein